MGATTPQLFACRRSAMDPPSVAKEALKLRIEREYAKLADLAAGETRAMYNELAHQADVAWHEQSTRPRECRQCALYRLDAAGNGRGGAFRAAPEGFALQVWTGELSPPVPSHRLDRDAAPGSYTPGLFVEVRLRGSGSPTAKRRAADPAPAARAPPLPR